MTTKTNLVQLKLAVIKFHEANPYLETAMARDACFTSHNGLSWKGSQMSDVAAEIKDLLPQRGQEIADTKLERLLTRYEQMEVELAVLEERHEADKSVYKAVAAEHGMTPREWTPAPKRTHVSSGLGIDSRLAKFGLAG
jgi:CRISPR/Cas system CSM-associated protein Csm2 small subunit